MWMRTLAVSAVLLIGACEQAEPPSSDDRPAVAAPRDTSPSDTSTGSLAPALRSALDSVMRGPTEAERSAGAESWFSQETATAIRSVEVDASGHAIVDFEDLRALIPNASSSAGSTMLLDELNEAVFRMPEILSVEYRMDGSCDLFWEWLQYGCRTVTRSEAEP